MVGTSVSMYYVLNGVLHTYVQQTRRWKREKDKKQEGMLENEVI